MCRDIIKNPEAAAGRGGAEGVVRRAVFGF